MVPLRSAFLALRRFFRKAASIPKITPGPGSSSTSPPLAWKERAESGRVPITAPTPKPQAWRCGSQGLPSPRRVWPSQASSAVTRLGARRSTLRAMLAANNPKKP